MGNQQTSLDEGMSYDLRLKTMLGKLYEEI